jgi:hypothetical protein
MGRGGTRPYLKTDTTPLSGTRQRRRMREIKKVGANWLRRLQRKSDCWKSPQFPLVNGQGDVDLIDGFGDVFGDVRLAFDLGGAKHVLEQSLGFAQLRV